MNYTTCGSKKISAMTFGTVQLGMNYGISNNLGKPSEEKSFAMLSKCSLEISDILSKGSTISSNSPSITFLYKTSQA